MTISDVVMVLAVFLGPIFAVRVSRHLDIEKGKAERKLSIFKTLMATRSYLSNWNHVEALNRIDLEFDKKKPKEKDVIDAWKAYLDILNAGEMAPDLWAQRRADLIVDLLHKMALVLSYDFDRTHIKNSAYSPRLHAVIEQQQSDIREKVLDLLDGRASLAIRIENLPSPPPPPPPSKLS